MLKHVPNTLTIIRFLLIPFIVACIFNGNFIAAFIITQISTLASLAIIHIIPIWILIIVLIKEFIMIVGASFLYGKDVVVYSRWYGKLATVLFYLAIVLSLVLRQFNITGAFEEYKTGEEVLCLYNTRKFSGYTVEGDTIYLNAMSITS